MRAFFFPGEVSYLDFIIRLFVKDHEKTESPQVREKVGRVAGMVGIATNLLLFLFKFLAGIFSHSLAIMADAVNNLTDSGSSVIMLVGFKLAGKPADEKHPFGHARIEYLCGVIVSFIVLFLGIQLGRSSIEKIFAPEETQYGLWALLTLLLSIGIKLWQYLFYRRVGKKIHSEALIATSGDSRNDAVTTAVVLLGALITRIWGWNLDGYLGLAVAVFILVSGVKLIVETGNPLLGVAPEKELVEDIYQTILSYEGVIGIHDLTVHNYGVGRCFASVHCEVPAEEDILKSHDIIDNIERDFEENKGIHLVIHLDPIVTGDERTNILREQVKECVRKIYPETSIHDFRVVWGVTHSNIVFDVAAPFSLADSDRQISERISQEISRLSEDYRTVITVDREGVVNALES